MKKKILNSFLFLLIGVFVLIGLDNVNAASDITNQYFNTARSNGVKVTASNSGVNVGKSIPKKYTLGLGETFASASCGGATAATDSQKAKWANYDQAHDLNYSNMFDNNNLCVSQAKKGFYVLYKNVGKYDGQDIDVKVSVDGFEENNYDTFDGYDPFIAFRQKGKIGVYVLKVNWVSLKYEFFKSGTSEKVKVSGYSTYWDVDGYQGIHFLDGHAGLYANNKANIYVTKVNSQPYVYENEFPLHHSEGYNDEYAIMETFSGDVLKRVYTFIRFKPGEKTTLGFSEGEIWNSGITTNAIKRYEKDTPKGMNHSAVKVGDTIRYEIEYTNGDPNNSANVVITDTLSNGLKYKAGSSKVNGEAVPDPSGADTQTLVWSGEKINLAKSSTAKLTYEVEVLSTAVEKVGNSAKAKIGDHEYTLDKLENPLPVKTYGGTGLSDNLGWDHAKVKVGNDIKYSIKLPNVKDKDVTIVVKDILSKGLTYNNDISVQNGTLTKTENPVTDSNTKATTISWTITVPKGETAVLNYSAKVNSDAVDQVNNNASCTYEGELEYPLAILENPIVKEASIINIPDTASTIAIAGVVAGVALIGGGGYLVYKRYKKA